MNMAMYRWTWVTIYVSSFYVFLLTSSAIFQRSNGHLKNSIDLTKQFHDLTESCAFILIPAPTCFWVTIELSSKLSDIYSDFIKQPETEKSKFFYQKWLISPFLGDYKPSDLNLMFLLTFFFRFCAKAYRMPIFNSRKLMWSLIIYPIQLPQKKNVTKS